MRGHTLIELAFVLLLTGVATTSFAPAARRYRDRASVVSAREAVIGLFAEARSAAIAAGAASVRITSDPWIATAITEDSTLRTVRVGSDFGVVMELSGDRAETEVRYDALGLGRFASETLVFRRGRASTEVIVSSYGRVRRR